MPKGDSDYIPRDPRNWAQAAQDWFRDDLEAKRRLKRTQAMLEPLRQDWTDEDKAWLCAWRIKVN